MTRFGAAVLLAGCLTAPRAGAQEFTPTVTLAPAHSARWDASGHLTWLGERRPDRSPGWNRWFGVASGGGSFGYQWAPHLKADIDITTSTEDESYSVDIVPLPGTTTPSYVQRDHELRFTTVGAGLTYQFFENVWFHPFVGAGIELVREREHVDIVTPPFGPQGPRSPAGVPAQGETRVRYGGRPYVATGFKVYLSEHAFFRSDLRTSWSRDGLSSLGWRNGFGVDF
jgi:hypothetical protein